MKTKVISAFPGTGKSYFSNQLGQRDKIIDLDTYEFTNGYDERGEFRNRDFPNNYILAIKEYLGKADILFVGCQPEVLDILRSEGIPFTLIYPKRELKNHYVSRYLERQSPQSFIDLLSNNWDRFLNLLEGQKDCEIIVLDEDQYISNVVSL